MQTVLFAGCEPEVSCGVDGRILAVGAKAREAAGRKAEVVRLRGDAWPGLIDSHIHLESLIGRKLAVDLTGAKELGDVLGRTRDWVKPLPKDAWVVGSGWYNDAWPSAAFPTRRQLDAAVGGRPAYLERKDGHSAWVSTAALRAAGIDVASENPPGGVIDRDGDGAPTGILRETAMDMVLRLLPTPSDADLDAAMTAVLRDLAALGLTSVHSMDTARALASLQRIRVQEPLPVRVTYNIPVADLPHAERMGVRSGWGDEWLRIWGVKAFLDGSVGSRTAAMLDGSGTPRLSQADLLDLIARAARAGLNVCLHAIGDGAVRRALDALSTRRNAGSGWRPRIEHAQCVDPKDVRRFARIGVIASMQPIHAVSDREMADAMWPGVVGHSYAWGALARAGARLAFGSDAPVETADPLAGIEAASVWRRKAKWHPELAISRAAALRAYSADAAYAVGMEKEAGTLRAGKLCEASVVATIVGGRVSFLRTPLSTSRPSSPKTR